MARINVDDFAFEDVRFNRIAATVKVSRNTVLGTMCTVWHHCTQRESYFITKADFNSLAEIPGVYEAALEVGLLKLKGEKIYVAGTRRRIEWLKKARARSKKGGEATRLKFKKARIERAEISNKNEVISEGLQPRLDQGSLHCPPSLAPALPPSPVPTLPLIPSLISCSSSGETTTTKEINSENVKDDDVKTDNVHNTTILETSQQLFEYYSKQLMDKHGIRAFKSSKTDEQLRAIVNQFSVDDAKRLIRVYLNEKEDQVVLRSSYQLGLLTTPFGLQKYSQQIQKAKPKVDPYPNSPGPMSRVEYMAMLERNAKEQAEKEAAQAAEKAKLEAQAMEVKSGEL